MSCKNIKCINLQFSPEWCVSLLGLCIAAHLWDMWGVAVAITGGFTKTTTWASPLTCSFYSSFQLDCFIVVLQGGTCIPCYDYWIKTETGKEICCKVQRESLLQMLKNLVKVKPFFVTIPVIQSPPQKKNPLSPPAENTPGHDGELNFIPPWEWLWHHNVSLQGTLAFRRMIRPKKKKIVILA